MLRNTRQYLKLKAPGINKYVGAARSQSIARPNFPVKGKSGYILIRLRVYQLVSSLTYHQTHIQIDGLENL